MYPDYSPLQRLVQSNLYSTLAFKGAERRLSKKHSEVRDTLRLSSRTSKALVVVAANSTISMLTRRFHPSSTQWAGEQWRGATFRSSVVYANSRRPIPKLDFSTLNEILTNGMTASAVKFYAIGWALSRQCFVDALPVLRSFGNMVSPSCTDFGAIPFRVFSKKETPYALI